jgi:hypothetical protein
LAFPGFVGAEFLWAVAEFIAVEAKDFNAIVNGVDNKNRVVNYKELSVEGFVHYFEFKAFRAFGSVVEHARKVVVHIHAGTIFEGEELFAAFVGIVVKHKMCNVTAVGVVSQKIEWVGEFDERFHGIKEKIPLTRVKKLNISSIEIDLPCGSFAEYVVVSDSISVKFCGVGQRGACKAVTFKG